MTAQCDNNVTFFLLTREKDYKFYRMIPLFKKYPLLEKKLPHLDLGEFPTPVNELAGFGGGNGTGTGGLGAGRLFIKRDDLSGKVYGGNKVRKLEFLLADAMKKGAKEVLTFGGAGSNHALATAIYSGQHGMKSISMLVPQPISKNVRRNLLLSQHFGAELHISASTKRLAVDVVKQLLIHRLRTGRFPVIIPPGGSSPLGAIGFVNAAMELKEQIDARMLPQPDLIYVALGSNGTAVGLMLGLKAAGLRTKVVPVRVTVKSFSNDAIFLRLFRKTNELLHGMDSSFPIFNPAPGDLGIRHEFFGRGYGVYTQEGIDAARLLKNASGITLEYTYTAKAFAALVHDADRGLLKDKTVLFWDTYNSREFANELKTADYHTLPKSFHEYFEKEVQTLDG